MYIERNISDRIAQLARLYPVILMTGARQTGKTELAKKMFPQHQWVLLDNLARIEAAQKDPTLFLQNYQVPVIFDEIQRCPNLFLAIKDVVDRTKPSHGAYILTGSQPLKLMKAASESLAGRVGIIELDPMVISERQNIENRPLVFETLLSDPPIGKVFSWKKTPIEQIFRGGFPAMCLDYLSPTEQDAGQRYFDFIQTYLTKDLRDFTLISNLGRFERFLRYLASQSGRILNISGASNELGIPQSTCNEWFSILEASCLCWTVSSFHRSHTKREKKRPKIFLCDSGLMLNLLAYQNSAQVNLSPVLGAAFETAAANAMRTMLRLNAPNWPMHHWRHEEKDEVDLVIETPTGQLCPIEIKMTSSPSSDDIRGIKAFWQTYNKSGPGFLISTATEFFWIDKQVLNVPYCAI